MPGTADPISGLLFTTLYGQGARWGTAGAPVTVTFGFDDTVPSVFGGRTQFPGFAALADWVKDEVRADLAAIAAVCGISFTEVPNGRTADIEILSFTVEAAFGFPPRFDENGDRHVSSGDVAYGTVLLTDTIRAQPLYTHMAILHELLHAVGLKHPHDGDATQQLPAALDRQEFTVMSYTAPNVAPSWRNGAIVWTTIEGNMPGVLDVNALQALYGPSRIQTATGDDIYRFDATPMQRLIVDSGGTDTIDASATSHPSVINLADGTTSSIGIWSANDWVDLLAASTSRSAAQSAVNGVGNFLYRGIDNLAIATGSKIENAIGGSGNDTLTGNTLNNVLTGGGGNDLLDGRDGTDTAVFSGARAAYDVHANADGSWTVQGADGTDTLRAIEVLQFSDRTIFTLTGEDATIARLYGAAFARAPDAGGLAVQLGAHAAGISAVSLANNFIQSAEFVARYGAGTSNTAFATALYSNVLGRTPDPDGLAVQIAALDHGLSRAQLLLNFADSNENRLHTNDWLLN
jgi:hypothetical protein